MRPLAGLLILLLALLSAPRGRAQTAIITGTPTCCYVATSDRTVANTTTETSLVGPGWGDTNIRGGSLFVGRTYRLVFYGYFGTTAVVPSCTIRIRCGNTTLVSSALFSSLVGTMSQQSFSGVFTFTCRANGPSGMVFGQGNVAYALNGSAKRDDLKMIAGAVLDTTVDDPLDVTVAWGTASPSNTITRTNMILETLN